MPPLPVSNTYASAQPAPPQVGLSVVIPAYNEAEGIHEVLVQLRQVLASLGLPSEIIVVDDGSQDRTASIVEQLVESTPAQESRLQPDKPELQPGEGVAASAGQIILLRHRRNLGYGAALKTGLRRARYELACITDADGTYPCQRIPALVSALIETHSDMVVGARLGKGAAIPLVRRPAKWFIARLAEMIAGEPIPDLNSGLRVFRKAVVRRFFSLLPDGFSFTTTITLGMLVNGYAVEYLPVDYYVRKGRSKIRPLHDTLRFIQLVLQIALYFAPLKIFLPFSLTLLFVGLAWAGFSYFVLGKLADASAAAIIMTAFQVAVTGLLADLINRRLPGYQKDE